MIGALPLGPQGRSGGLRSPRFFTRQQLRIKGGEGEFGHPEYPLTIFLGTSVQGCLFFLSPCTFLPCSIPSISHPHRTSVYGSMEFSDVLVLLHVV